MPDREHRIQAERAATAALKSIDLEKPAQDTVARVLDVFAAHGLLAFGFSEPSATGPQPGDMRKACAIIDELAYHSGALATIYMVSGLLAPLCVSYGGTPEQKAALLPQVAAGKLQLAFAMTEPDAGSDAASIATTALPDGSDRIVINGEKIYITGAETADLILTIARTSTTHAKAFGVMMVPKNADGMTIAPLPKLAGNAMPSCRITFDGTAVPASDVVGGERGLENAWQVLRHTGSLERLVVAAMSCGLARAATARATMFIRERRAFGKPLKDFQSIQHLVVEMATITKGMELFADNAIRAQDNDEDPAQAISMAKYFCSEQAQRVVEIAVRVMGGRAYFDFEPVSRFYREAPFCLFAGGTVEIQKMLIARSMGI